MNCLPEYKLDQPVVYTCPECEADEALDDVMGKIEIYSPRMSLREFRDLRDDVAELVRDGFVQVARDDAGCDARLCEKHRG